MKNEKKHSLGNFVLCVGLCASLVSVSVTSAPEAEGAITDALAQAETECVTETVAETMTETVAETVTEAVTETMTEVAAETAAEILTEASAETEDIIMQETQAETEYVTEATTEAETEILEEAAQTAGPEEELIVGEEVFAPVTTAATPEESAARLQEGYESGLPEFDLSEKTEFGLPEGGQITLDILSGECGAAGAPVFWRLEDGVLTISGTGEMASWEDTEQVPWYEERDSITKLVVEEGVTSVGDFAFCGFSGIREICLADSVASVGAYAFFGCSGLGSVSLG